MEKGFIGYCHPINILNTVFEVFFGYGLWRGVMRHGGRAGFRSAYKLLFALLVFRYELVDLADKLKEPLRNGNRLPKRYQERITVNSRFFKHQKGRLHRERYGLVAVAWHRSDNSRKGNSRRFGEGKLSRKLSRPGLWVCLC